MKDKEIETSYSEDNCDSSKVGQLNSFDLAVGDKETRSTQLVFKYQGGRKVPKLREPRSLYAFCKERGIQSAPRWPAHIKVINSRIRHITTVPKNEPCELIENEVPISLCRLPDEEGKLVYDNPPGPEQYFLRSRAGGAQVPNRPFYKLGSSSDRTLIFESRFESGNLQRAIKVKEYEYQLWLRNDLYTNKHTQWFYFRVQNVKSGVRYKFSIMNLLKSGSLYNDGMRPLMYSEITATKNKVGWTRIGEDIVYYKNEIRREDTIKEKYHYSLTWATEFPHDNDTCYFAHCYPYTYSDLQEYLQEIRTDPMRSRICKQRVLCRTLAGNFVYALTITNPSRRPADAEAKRAVVLTARVHPGETNSSWMMKGLIDFLTSNAPDAKLLRDTFIFKVVPMINPDGVIVGNYRCSLSGRDLNRNYKTVLKDSFPPIWHIRNMVRKLMEEREVIVYCDLHGHSRKQNVFIYGCENRFDPLKRLRERIFPVMMSKNAPTKFSYKGCKFKVQKSKEGTGRIVMWHMGITNSYTMEATFCGSSLGKNSDLHFNTKDFESMGFLLCDTLLDYCDPDDSKYVAILLDLELKLKADILERMKKKGLAPISMTEADVDFNTHYTSDIESSTGGSDSSGSDGLPMHLIYAPETLQLHQCRKKKLKTRKERNKRRAKALKVKEVVLADVVQRSGLGHTDAVLPTEAKLTYHKSPKRSSLPSPGRFKFENPRPRKHEHKDSSSRSCTPCHARPDDQAARRIDYLEAVTTAFMMNGVIVTEAKEVPQFRYTAGSAYLRERQSPSRSISRWSSDTPVAVVPEASDGEEQFTLSYMSKQLRERNSPKLFLPSESVVAPVINERNVNSAMDLARKISVYSSRAKALAAGQDLPADLQTPSLRPRTPVQPYPHYPWQPKGECLSSTKARLYEQPRPQREFAELKKSLSQLSVEEKKTKKARKKKLVSTSMTECSSFDPENGYSLLIGGKSTSSADMPAQRRKGQSSTSSKQEEITWQLRTTTLQGTLEPQLQKPSTQLKSMKKYTGGYERVTHSIETDARSKEQVQFLSPVPSRVAPMNSPPSHGKAADQPKSNLSPWQLSSYVKPLGAQASYANVGVARANVQPPQSKQETSLNESYSAISTINELRDKLMSMEESGNSATCSSDIQKEKRNTQVDDSSDSDNGNKRENRAICDKPLSSGNAGLSGLEAEGVTSLRNASQSPIAPGIVRIGLNQDRESSGGSGSKLNEQRNQDPGAAPSTISLTFQFDGTSSRDPPLQQNGPRASVFPPQLKHFYRPPHHK